MHNRTAPKAACTHARTLRGAVEERRQEPQGLTVEELAQDNGKKKHFSSRVISPSVS